MLDPSRFYRRLRGPSHASRRAFLLWPEGKLLRWRSNFAHHFAHSWIPKRSYGDG